MTPSPGRPSYMTLPGQFWLNMTMTMTMMMVYLTHITMLCVCQHHFELLHTSSTASISSIFFFYVPADVSYKYAYLLYCFLFRLLATVWFHIEYLFDFLLVGGLFEIVDMKGVLIYKPFPYFRHLWFVTV